MQSTSKTKKPSKNNKTEELDVEWDLTDVLSDLVQWDRRAVNNIVTMLDNDDTIPFIARYRKEKTNNMDANKLREVKVHLDELRLVLSRIANVKKSLLKQGVLGADISRALSRAQSMEEVEHLYAPYKPGTKRSLANRAKDLGLEPLAMSVLQAPSFVNLQKSVQPGHEGLSSLEEVKKGVQHILAEYFSKDKDVMDLTRNLMKSHAICIESTQSKSARSTAKETAKTTTKSSQKPGSKSSAKSAAKTAKPEQVEKFENYFNFRCSVQTVKPHQVLALNRGENLKVLTVKMFIPSMIKGKILDLISKKFLRRDMSWELKELMNVASIDCYNRIIEPLMSRKVRSDLTKTAELASVDVFKSNLRRLLLTPPVKGSVVMGLDPGYRNGCKYAITSKSGDVLDTGVLYLHGNPSKQHSEVQKLKEVLIKHRCETVAVGNGVAGRETEVLLVKHIKQGTFKPLQPSYWIIRFRHVFSTVSESGASIYSASEEAARELPQLDITLRGAVSIARRLQDPLAELVKIEPKHIGVGMYQHDISEKVMQSALEGVVEDCVSHVGVDLNVCTALLLRQVAGLGKSLAERVIEWREEHGGFINRQQLLLVRGLGPKTFKQCAGFVRILPVTMNSDTQCSTDDVPKTTKAGTKRKAAQPKSAAKKLKMDSDMSPNPLDRTTIHPESYDTVQKMLQDFGMCCSNIGTNPFVSAIESALGSRKDLKVLAEEYDTGLPTMKLIMNALQQTVQYDVRDEFDKPLFKQDLTTLADIHVGTTMTGRVTNATHFGAFVDVGVETDGLIHVSQIFTKLLKGKESLELGDRVKVTVVNVEPHRKRLGLKLMELL